MIFDILLLRSVITWGPERTQCTRGALDFSTNIIAERGGFLGAQRELNAALSCLSIVCCKKFF
jgi:hypothetical protein